MANANIPEGYRSVAPYLVVRGASDAIQFYERAFNARERMRLTLPGGLIGHAEMQFGDSVVMLADENPDWEVLGPSAFGGTPVSIHLYVTNVDQLFQQAVDAGAKVLKPLQNQFYGDRSGFLEDPFGHRWSLAQRVEEVSLEEMQRRIGAGVNND
ncbi:MAG: VOC family protein [Planctomycetaceae bacterium]